MNPEAVMLGQSIQCSSLRAQTLEVKKKMVKRSIKEFKITSKMSL